MPTLEEEELEKARIILQEKQHRNGLLLENIERYKLKEVQRLLAEGVSPNATCRKNQLSACHSAAAANWEALRILLAVGADRYRKDLTGFTTLHTAAFMGGTRRVAMLLDFPEDLQFKVAITITEQTMKEIKEFKPLISPANIQLMNTVASVQDEDIPIPEEYYDLEDDAHDCLDPNEDVDITEEWNKKNWTALHIASIKNQSACVRVLLAAGADPNVKDKDGYTALDLAYRTPYKSNSFLNPLNEEKKEFISMIKTLLEFGAKFHPRKQNSVLKTALLRQCTEILPILLEAGAPVKFNRMYPLIDLCGLEKLHECRKVRKKILIEFVNRVHGKAFPLEFNEKEAYARAKEEKERIRLAAVWGNRSDDEE